MCLGEGFKLSVVVRQGVQMHFASGCVIRQVHVKLRLLSGKLGEFLTHDSACHIGRQTEDGSSQPYWDLVDGSVSFTCYKLEREYRRLSPPIMAATCIRSERCTPSTFRYSPHAIQTLFKPYVMLEMYLKTPPPCHPPPL
jgi:hypothetical protein